LRDVQAILGYAHRSAKAEMFLVQDPDQLNGRVRQHLEERATQPRPQTSLGDDVSDLAVFPRGP
jgi:hypothetical protein